MSRLHRCLALSASLLLGGCISRTPAAMSAAGPHHDFEGTIVYEGLEGPAPGRPFSAQCTVRGTDARCDWIESSMPMGYLGFDGANVCWKPTFFPKPVALSYATLGAFVAALPESVRRTAVSKAQGMYRWTGRTDQVLGWRCRELEARGPDGLELTCYSPDEFYAGDRQAIPILRQMGFDSTFISSLSEGGIGWRSVEFDQTGRQTLAVQAVRIDPHPVDPRLVMGVCQ